ncbi:hypothetical protein [Streptomyces anulatus]|uniref:hypothetical protein n=1 Tax=Streptomyces anulatus TaxID=1892 RepID=UPI0004C893D2|nr:hypothetical protein [Streptomyces anulatus]
MAGELLALGKRDKLSRAGYAWHDAGSELRTLQRLVEDAGRHAEVAVDAWLDGEELRSGADALAWQLKRTAVLLEELHRDDGQNPVDEELLAGVLKPAPSLVDRARRRGDLCQLRRELARRSSRLTVAGDRWQATWHQGQVTARSEDGRVVRGYAAAPEAVEQFLQPFEATSCHRPRARVVVVDERPEHRVTDRHTAGTSYTDRAAAFDADSAALAGVVAALNGLRQQWPAEAVAERVHSAAEELQLVAPPAPSFSLYRGTWPYWATSTSAGWVSTPAVVSGIDPIWGVFDRAEELRGAGWVSRAASELLATDPGDLPGFLRHHLLAGGSVDLTVINGPAGPLYTVSSGGAHRTHLFKILGLPFLFAHLTARIAPSRIDVTSVIDTSKGVAEAKRVAEGWHLLIERGLVHGTVSYQGEFATLHIDFAPAPWLLGNDAFVTAYNQAYERVYPGALAQLGVPTHALADEQTWRAWLHT